MVVEKPSTRVSLSKPLFVLGTGAHGRLLAETQNRFSQNPRDGLLSFLSIPYLSSASPYPIETSPFTPSHPLPLSPLLPSPLLRFVPAQMRHPTETSVPSLWRAFKLSGPESHIHVVCRTIKGIINFAFVEAADVRRNWWIWISWNRQSWTVAWGIKSKRILGGGGVRRTVIGSVIDGLII